MMGTQQEDKLSLSLRSLLCHRSLWSRAEATYRTLQCGAQKQVTHTAATSKQQVSVCGFSLLGTQQ